MLGKLVLASAILAGLYWVLAPKGPSDPGAQQVFLHNTTDVHVKVWENTEGYSYLVTELDPGESETVFWMPRLSPSYRVEDPNHQTIYCGPNQRGIYGPGSYHQGKVSVEIVRLKSISTIAQDGMTLCDPPG